MVCGFDAPDLEVDEVVTSAGVIADECSRADDNGG